MSEQKAEKAPRDRSPSFPFISLRAAITRLEEFENKFGRQEPTADRAYLAWGMKGDTSQAQQTIAALKSFGLIDYKGSGPKRLVAISDEARKYLRAQQDHIKREVLKNAALKPKWMAYFWGQWAADKVPDEIRLDRLVLDHKFNENTAPKFLRVYDETIAFAGLSSSDKVQLPNAASGDEEDEPELPSVEIGDLIQAEVSGALAFERPRRVRAIKERDGEHWVFVEQSQTGIPMQQVEVIEKGQGASNSPPKLPLDKTDVTAPQGTRKEVITLDEGDVVIVFPENLSANSFGDLKDHLDLFIKKMQRRAGTPQ